MYANKHGQSWVFLVRTYSYASKKCKNLTQTNNCGYLLAFFFFFGYPQLSANLYLSDCKYLYLPISISFCQQLLASITKYSQNSVKLYISSNLRLQTFVDIGKNQYFQTYEYANIRNFPHLYVGCELLPGFAHA